MKIETKFSNGDRVFRAYTNWGPSGQRDCEECGGTGRLKIEGKSVTIACTNGCRHGKFSSYTFLPLTEQLTIGQVRVAITESPGTDDERGGIKSTDGTGFSNYSPISKREEQYMCIETGIGSGSIYDVENLFVTEAEAHEHAKLKVIEAIEFRRVEDERLEKQRQQERQRLQLEEQEYV